MDPVLLLKKRERSRIPVLLILCVVFITFIIVEYALLKVLPQICSSLMTVNFISAICFFFSALISLMAGAAAWYVVSVRERH